MAEVYPEVPVADSVSGNDTLLDISHAREVLGYDPQFRLARPRRRRVSGLRSS